MTDAEYEVIQRFFRLKIIQFAKQYHLPTQLILYCLREPKEGSSEFISVSNEINQFFNMLGNLNSDEFPLHLLEFKKKCISTALLKEGLEKFKQEDVCRFDGLTLSEALLSRCYQQKAHDGGLYSKKYTEIRIFDEASCDKLADGAIKLCWDKEKTYRKCYALETKKNFPLKPELEHLKFVSRIEFYPVHEDYHQGCIIPTLSVQLLKNSGLKDPVNADETGHYKQTVSSFSYLEAMKKGELSSEMHKVIQEIINRELNFLSFSSLNPHGLTKIRLSRVIDPLGIGFFGLVYNYELQNLVFEFTTTQEKLSFIPALASELQCSVDRLHKSDRDLGERCLSLPLSVMKKLFGISFSDLLRSKNLTLLQQRELVFGDDVEAYNKLLKMQSSVEIRTEELKPKILSADTKPSKSSLFKLANNPILPGKEQIDAVFELDQTMIVTCKKGINNSIELLTSDRKRAEELLKIIKNRMSTENDYWIRLFEDRFAGEFYVEIVSKAVSDFINLLNNKTPKLCG